MSKSKNKIKVTKNSLMEGRPGSTCPKVNPLYDGLEKLRFYMPQPGRIMPSVNTFLDLTNPPGPRCAIAKWRDRMLRDLGPEVGSRKLRMYSTRGTLLHAMIEHYIVEGEWVEPYDHPDWLDCVEEFDGGGWLEVVQPFVESLNGKVAVMEHPLYDLNLDLAGTPDLNLYEGEGHYALYDWKTSDKPKAISPINKWGYHLDNPIESCFPNKLYKTNYSLQNKLCQLLAYLMFCEPTTLNTRYGVNLPPRLSFSLNLVTFNTCTDKEKNPSLNHLEVITLDTRKVEDLKLIGKLTQEIKNRVAILKEIWGTPY